MACLTCAVYRFPLRVWVRITWATHHIQRLWLWLLLQTWFQSGSHLARFQLRHFSEWWQASCELSLCSSYQYWLSCRLCTSAALVLRLHFSAFRFAEFAPFSSAFPLPFSLCLRMSYRRQDFLLWVSALCEVCPTFRWAHGISSWRFLSQGRTILSEEQLKSFWFFSLHGFFQSSEVSDYLAESATASWEQL